MADVNIKISLQAQGAIKQLDRLNASLQTTVSHQQKLASASRSASDRVSKLGDAGKQASKGLNVASISLASFVGNLTSRVVSSAVTGLINGFRAIVQAGRDFEDGLVNVGKTTGISGKNLEKLGNRITKISREIPVATNGLLEIATVAGQLGLKSSDDIAQFTETLGKLTLASDIAGEEGAQSVAKILTITGELEQNGSENIDKFGNVITRLGNNFAATESQILKVANRVSQGLAGFGVNSEDVLALGAALKATGSEAEASGTAIQKTFRLMGKAVQDGGESLSTFANAAGMSTEAFSNLFKQDPVKAFESLAKSMGESGSTGAELNSQLEKLGLSDERLVRTLNPLIARHQELSRAISDARQEAQDRTALDDESSKAADKLSSDIQELSNSFDDLAKVIFTSLGPALRDLVQRMTSFLDKVNGAIQSDAFGKLAAGMSAISKEVVNANPRLKLLSVALKELFKNEIEVKKRAAELVKEMEGYVDTAESVAEETKDQTAAFLDLDNIQKEVNKNYVETDDISQRASVSAKNAAEKIKFFEQDKLKNLKKFFTEEEQARLQLKFATLKNAEEIRAFNRVFISEGTKRQSDALLATIGLNKAEVEAAKAKQKQLEELRSAQDQFDEEMLRKREQREEALKQKQLEASLAEDQNRLLKQAGDIAFEDEEFARLTANLDRKTQAEFAAREALIKNELDKEILRAEIRKKAADDEIKQRERVKNTVISIERQKQTAQLGLAKAGATALFQLAGANNKAMFALNKAFAIADILVKGAQAQALISATIPYPANIPASAAQASLTNIQLATVVASAIGEASAGNFANGGIVGGNSMVGDRLTANVNSGEMILNRQQQNQLFKMANGRDNNSEGGTVVNQPIVIQLDNEVIGEATSKWVANGGQLGEVQ